MIKQIVVCDCCGKELKSNSERCLQKIADSASKEEPSE